MRFLDIAYLVVLAPIACGGDPNGAMLVDGGADGDLHGPADASGASLGDEGDDAGANVRTPTDASESSLADGRALGTLADAGPSCTRALSVVKDAAAAALGASCIPPIENDPTFSGFAEQEISLISDDTQCGSGTCLVNHFRGRVTCPYGQDVSGSGPDGLPGCVTPDLCVPVRPPLGANVEGQCTDRVAADAVYCSCRCANVSGGVDDAGPYCTCPDTMSCVQLVASIGGNDTMSGAYCVKAGTEFDGGSGCAMTCDPKNSPCP